MRVQLPSRPLTLCQPGKTCDQSAAFLRVRFSVEGYSLKTQQLVQLTWTQGLFILAWAQYPPQIPHHSAGKDKLRRLRSGWAKPGQSEFKRKNKLPKKVLPKISRPPIGQTPRLSGEAPKSLNRTKSHRLEVVALVYEPAGSNTKHRRL